MAGLKIGLEVLARRAEEKTPMRSLGAYRSQMAMAKSACAAAIRSQPAVGRSHRA
ncbi:hypothetical protein ACFSHT_24570 [Paraburkholderia silviterrae]|uniref:hypothetical protein n=1 Tax=Paraburkholderia silviterrae TaxID=2528715 RepID=UPI00140523E9|nr:hypothetical protein [Paraburkholderia silviterrae]